MASSLSSSLFTSFYRLDYIFFLILFFFWHVSIGRLQLFKSEGSEVDSTELFVTCLSCLVSVPTSLLLVSIDLQKYLFIAS